MLKKFCNKTGCNEIITATEKYCAKHLINNVAELKTKQRDRESPSKRGYDRNWEKIRKHKLSITPLCEDCRAKNKIKTATEVHHIKKIRDYPELRLTLNNLMSLCERCHKSRTAKGE